MEDKGLPMQKIVLNTCYGGFSMKVEYAKRTSLCTCDYSARKCYCLHDKRSHPELIQLIEQYGKDASSKNAELRIFEIPENILYQIKEHHGSESIVNLVPKRGLETEKTELLLEWIRKFYFYDE